MYVPETTEPFEIFALGAQTSSFTVGLLTVTVQETVYVLELDVVLALIVATPLDIAVTHPFFIVATSSFDEDQTIFEYVAFVGEISKFKVIVSPVKRDAVVSLKAMLVIGIMGFVTVTVQEAE